jgi:hypothetical protein
MLRRLVLFVVLVIGLVLPSMASARTRAEHQTRVWGFDLAGQTLVGGPSTPRLGKHRANSLAYGENASGYSLAAEGFTSRSAGVAFDTAKLARIQANLEGQGVSFVTGEEGGRLAAAFGGEAAYIPTPGQPGIIAPWTEPIARSRRRRAASPRPASRFRLG